MLLQNGNSGEKWKKLIKTTVLFFVGSIGSKLLTYLLIPFYTAVLSTKEYGISDAIFTTVSLIYPILTLAINEATFRFAMDKEYNQAQTFMIGTSVSMAGFLVVSAVGAVLIRYTTLVPYLWYFIIYYLVTVFQVLLSQFAKGISCIKQFTISGVLGTLVTLISIILCLKPLHMGVRGYLLAYILGYAVICGYLYISCRMYRYHMPLRKISIRQLKEMLRFSIPIIPNAVSWWISTSSDKYILIAFYGYSVTGIYSIAYKLPSLLTTLTGIFLSAWQISAIEEFGKDSAASTYNRIYQYFHTLLLVAIAGVIPFSRIIARLVFSKDFYVAWVYVPILLLAYLFHDLAAYLGSIYMASKRTQMIFLSTITGAIMNITLNFLLIPYYEAMGAAVATCISYFVVWVIRAICLKNYLSIGNTMNKAFLCYVLLALESILEVFNNKYASIAGLCAFVVIVLLNRREVQSLIKTMKGIVKKKSV